MWYKNQCTGSFRLSGLSSVLTPVMQLAAVMIITKNNMTLKQAEISVSYF